MDEINNLIEEQKPKEQQFFFLSFSFFFLSVKYSYEKKEEEKLHIFLLENLNENFTIKNESIF